jgi:C-terminal processing protease CtpA/Prc
MQAPKKARMAAMKTLCFLGLGLLISCPAVGQDPSSFVTGIGLVGGVDSCPVFVRYVCEPSPAERAGVKSGDVLIAVDGTRVSTGDEAFKLLQSEKPNPVTLTLARQEKPYVATVGREQRSMLPCNQRDKVLKSGVIVPLDATETEINGKLGSITRDRFVDRVFPTHYPSNEKLYYPGFEVMILKNPAQVVVLGIEDGPASRAGVHWGDTILFVNGQDPRNKSVTELVSLFSSQKPGSMTLKMEREGATKEFTFQLAETAQVLRDNQKQLLQGELVPLGLPERYLYCFK